MRTCIIVFFFALIVSLAAGLRFGILSPIKSDGYYYLQLAQSLAAGNGYRVPHGFWPDAPSMRRLPAWPAVVAAALKALPGADADTVMRLLALLLNATAAVAICILTVRIFENRLGGLVAGLAYGCHPAGVYYALNGFSEPLFVLLVTSAIICLPAAGNRTGTLSRAEIYSHAVAGGILAGLASLVRANFVLWPVVVMCLAAVFFLRTRRMLSVRLAPLVVALTISFIPPSLWMYRNYRVSGAFPVLSSLRGQTFYGGNNPVVAGTHEYWGYWVFPDRIPGETPMAELARTMSEYEVDRYYYNKGKEYVRNNISSYPKLLFGKLFRAYVPLPWHAEPGTIAVSAYRWLLYFGVILGLFTARRRIGPMYGIFLTALVITSLVTVLTFWGCARFAFALEPFFLPLLAAPAGDLLARSRLFQRL